MLKQTANSVTAKLTATRTKMQAASFLVCLVLASSVLLAQQGAAKFSYPARVVQEDSCPSSEQREAIRSGINGELNTLLQDFVAPPLSPCGGLGWRRVAYVNTTETNSCPSPWQLTTLAGKRLCTIPSSYRNYDTCSFVTFDISNLPYDQVCGRIIGYQHGATGAFRSRSYSISQQYVTGVSVRHSSTHIWTFASGLAEITHTSLPSLCPCSLNSTNGARKPSFVGDNYFCDTGTMVYNRPNFLFTGDPLWDGQGCGPNNNCCTFNSPPWFNVRLSSPTTENIQVGICRNSQATTPLELVVIYVR